MGRTGYQPVPLGNLPSGMGGGIRCSINACLANGARPVPPGWSPGGTGRWPVLPKTGFSDRLSEPDVKVSLHPAQAAAKPRLRRSRFPCRFQSSLVSVEAELFEERTVFKVGTPAWVERIGCAPDFQMPTDADVRWPDQLQPDGFSVGRPFSRVRREHILAANGVPVSLAHPSASFAGVPVLAPAPEAVPQSPIHFLESPFRRDVAVIKGPAPQNGVELTDQVSLAESATAANDLAHLLQEGVRVFSWRVG